jgi:hypothetical protein
VGTRLAGDLGDAAAGEKIEMVADDAGGEGVSLPASLELKEEALGEVGGTDAGRLEGLEDAGGLLCGFKGEACLEGGLGRGLSEEAAFVEATDEVAECVENLGGEVEKADLADEVFLEGGLDDEGIEKVLAALSVFGGVRLAGALIVEIFAPVVAQFGEDFELFGKIERFGSVRGRVGGWGGGGVGTVVGVGGAVDVVMGGVGGGVEAVGLAGDVLKGGVILKLFLDDGAEIESGDLKDFQGLPELGRENEGLVLALAEILVKAGAHALWCVRRFQAGRGARGGKRRAAGL